MRRSSGITRAFSGGQLSRGEMRPPRPSDAMDAGWGDWETESDVFNSAFDDAGVLKWPFLRIRSATAI